MRRHYYLIIVLVFLVAIRTLPFELVTSQTRLDNWAEMSFAIGAAVLTLVGIVTSVVVGGENDRRGEFVGNSNFVLRELEQKARINPDRTLTEVYDNSINKLRATTEERQPMNYYDGVIGILSFYSFLVSAVLALENFDLLSLPFLLLNWPLGYGWYGWP